VSSTTSVARTLRSSLSIPIARPIVLANLSMAHPSSLPTQASIFLPRRPKRAHLEDSVGGADRQSRTSQLPRPHRRAGQATACDIAAAAAPASHPTPRPLGKDGIVRGPAGGRLRVRSPTAPDPPGPKEADAGACWNPDFRGSTTPDGDDPLTALSRQRLRRPM
jgi:hypothetical protein